MIRPPKPLLIILTGFLFSLAWFHGAFSASQVPPFSDLPSNPLYYPAIELFREQNIIVGDTRGGQPIGQLRPSDLLQRDEFTKVAVVVRLLEEGNTQLLSLELDPFTLALSTLLKSYYKVTSSNGAVPFKDIQEKPDNCAAEPSGCSPWHTEFINFASSRGMIRGYAQDGTFRPVNPILRIHALKLTIASNGNLPADQDPKVIRITNDPRLEGRKVRCLVGTEDYILANNGGNNQDAYNLLAYAMQADRLDIFGNRCQAFTEAGASTPKQRAAFLQQPLKRQEIARYFALTTTIPQLQLDPSTDPTVDTRSEYITPVSQELTEEGDPMEKLSKKGESNDRLPVNVPSISEDMVELESELALLGGSDYPTSGIEACGPIPTDRSNSRDMVLDCVRKLRLSGKSEAEIDSLLKAYGLYELVKDKRGDNNIIAGTVRVASTGDIAYGPVRSEVAEQLRKFGAVVDQGAQKLKNNSYYVTPNKPTIWICTDIRDKDYAKSANACATTVKQGEFMQTEGGILVGRYSSDGKTKLWQKVSYNGKSYYALLRDLYYGYADSDVEGYISLRLEAEQGTSAASRMGNVASYDGVPDEPNWAEPINVLTGNFWSEKTDLSLQTRGPSAAITRTYNAHHLTEGPMGTGWSFAYDITLALNELGLIEMTFGDGHRITFSEDEEGIYRPDNRDGDITKQKEGFLYRQKSGQSYEFTNDGKLLSIKDRFGNGLHFDRTEGKLITEVRDDIETLFTLEYSDDGYITKVTDLGGREVKYSYDDGNLVKVCGPKFWSCYKYSYDEQHRLLTIKNEKGRVMIENVYDEQSRVIRQTDVLGAVVTLKYEEGKTVMTDALGQSKTHHYNAAYQTTLEEDALGHGKQFIYDDFGRLQKLIDARGNEVTYEYNASGNKISETDALGQVTKYAYSLSHQLTAVTGPKGHETTMEYDNDGNLIKLTDALGNSTLYAYDEFSQKISEENANGAVTRWDYNDDGTLNSVTDPLGNITLYAYDEARRLIKVTDPLGNATEFDYDQKDELTEVETAGIDAGKTKYDRLGNKVYEKDANKNKSKYYYDEKNRLLKEKNAEGEKTDYIYDDNDNLLKSFSDDAETKYDYDAAGRLITVTSALGHTLSYEYDENGNKTKVTDPEGGETQFFYDALNRLTKVIDAEGGVTAFTHDENGNLIKVINAEGGIKTAEFDALNRLTKSVDEMGYETLYQYDALGNQTKIVDPNGGILTFEYDLNGNLSAETDAQNGKTLYYYDALNRVAQVIDPRGNKTLFAYDKLGRVVGQKDDMGGETAFRYDAAGNRIKSTDANGNSAKFVYDDLNRLIKSSDLAGNVTESTYDKAGNLMEVKDARGAVYRYEYDKLGRMTKTIAPNGLVSEFSYDKNDRQTKISADGKATHFEYDKLGRLLSQTDALGQTSHFEYDKLGRKIRSTDPAGNSTEYAYDALGQNTAIKNALGHVKTSTYDALGNVLSKTDFNGVTAHYEYDKNGRLTALIDSAGRKVSYKYDAAGNQISVKSPDGSIVQNVYDALGRLSKMSNHLGFGTRYAYDAIGNKVMQERFADGETAQQTFYTYDALGHLASATDALGQTVEYAYDENSNRTRITDQNGHVTTTEFDAMNRPLKTTDPLGYSEFWTYDSFGNVMAYTDKNGLTETRTYDALSRLTKKQKGDLTVTQTYDALGNMTAIEDANGKITITYNPVGFVESVTDQNGHAAYYKHDPTGNLLKRSDLTGTTEYRYDNNAVTQMAFVPKDGNARKPFTYDFAYTVLGQIEKVTYPNQSSTVYSYDDLGRLTAIQTGNEMSIEYAYNAFDLKTSATTMTAEEIIEETFAYDPAGRLTAWTKNGQTESYEYDPAYNRTAVTTADGQTTAYRYNAMNQLTSDGQNKYRYDQNGFLISDGTASYTWDAYGHLTAYTAPDATIAYTYDPLNRMTARTGSLTATDFTYAGLASQFVLESTQEQKSTEEGSAPPQLTAYLYDMNGSPLARYNAGRPYAFLKNAHHDIVGHLDESGSLAEKIDTTVFGSSDTDQTLAFQGQYADPATNLSHLNARLYNADTAQFLSPDPFPGLTDTPYSLNKYAYSHNDPVNYWDESGMYGSEVHYYETKTWAYTAAMNTGFSYEASRQLALNIASFDQYHDKEWMLAPNNYAFGEGQGNALHFQNPNRVQITQGEVQIGGQIPFAYASNINRSNEYVDPNVIKVGNTTIPVFKMKSLSEFNSKDGADQLSNDPRAIRDGKALTYLELSGGTVKDRMQQAINEHDPRLFGIAMHEYQDTFAHAGFEKWHGTSHDNDIYCAENDYSSECTFTSVGNNTPSKSDQVKKELYARDRLMKAGTQYWMQKFMISQAAYYDYEVFQKANSVNKAAKFEKMITPENRNGTLYEVNDILNVEDEFGGAQFRENLGDDVFFNQSIGPGKNSCFYIDSSSGLPMVHVGLSGCTTITADLFNQISR